MSKNTDQTLVMLSSIAGCLDTLRATNAYARMDIKNAISAGFDACRSAIINWPCMCNAKWVKSRRERFSEFIGGMPDEGYSSVALVCMSDRMITYMIERDAGLAKKTALLAPIFENVRKVYEFCTTAGDNFTEWEMSAELVNELERIIGIKEGV